MRLSWPRYPGEEERREDGSLGLVIPVKRRGEGGGDLSRPRYPNKRREERRRAL